MEQNEQKMEEKRPKGRPPRKYPNIPDDARGTIQIVKSEFVKKADTAKPKLMTPTELKESLNLPKKPLSEAQKANLQKMLEANKARRDAKKIEIPEEVPEGYEAVYIPPSKSMYAKKEEPIKMLPPATAPVQQNIPPEWLEMMRQMNDRMNMLTTQYTKPKESKPKPPKKKQYKRRDETSDTQDTETETDTGYDTSDTEYVKKYEKKAERRIKAVKEIEEKLQKKAPPPAPVQPPKPRTKYDNISVF